MSIQQKDQIRIVKSNIPIYVSLNKILLSIKAVDKLCFLKFSRLFEQKNGILHQCVLATVVTSSGLQEL